MVTKVLAVPWKAVLSDDCTLLKVNAKAFGFLSSSFLIGCTCTCTCVFSDREKQNCRERSWQATGQKTMMKRYYVQDEDE